MIVNSDLLKFAEDLKNLKEIANNSNYTFLKEGICNKELVQSLFNKYNFSEVIHFAAKPYVDYLIKNYWMESPNIFKKNFKNSIFHHISTDEVYGILGDEWLFTEHIPYAPNRRYSPSKSSLDFMVRSYFHMYGLNVITANFSNNYVPKQHDKKLMSTIIRKAILGENIPIRVPEKC